MTYTIFNDHPYLDEFTANVTGITQKYLILDRTAFCPSTSSSPGDVGSIAGVDVVAVDRGRDGDIRHEHRDLSGVRKLRVGDTIGGRINWSRRIRHMRLVSAAALVEWKLANQQPVGRTVRFDWSPHNRALIAQPRSTLGPGSSVSARVDGGLDIEPLRVWLAALISDDVPIGRTRDAASRDRWFSHLDGVGTMKSEGVMVGSTGEIGDVDLDVLSADSAVASLVISVK